MMIHCQFHSEAIQAIPSTVSSCVWSTDLDCYYVRVELIKCAIIKTSSEHYGVERYFFQHKLDPFAEE